MSYEDISICAVYKVCVLPLYSRGPNVSGRRVGTDKNGGD